MTQHALSLRLGLDPTYDRLSLRALAADLLQRLLQRRQVPEVLDLEIAGLAGELAGLGVELEVGPHRSGSATLWIEQAVLGRAGVVGGDAGEYLLRQVRQKIALGALGLDDTGVLG